MAELSAEEAYKAATEDFTQAQKRVKEALRHKLISPSRAQALFVEELDRLYTDRIRRGELPTPDDWRKVS